MESPDISMYNTVLDRLPHRQCIVRVYMESSDISMYLYSSR